MSDSLAAAAAVNGPTSTITCPIDVCTWDIDATPPQIPPTALAAIFGLGVMTAVSAVENAGRVEQALKRHLDTHPVIDYVRTIAGLRERLDHARGQADIDTRALQAMAQEKAAAIAELKAAQRRAEF